MDIVINAVKDLVKFKAVGLVNTGDKTLDNLVNTLVLAIIAIAFTQSYYETPLKWILNQYRLWGFGKLKARDHVKLNHVNCKTYETYLETIKNVACQISFSLKKEKTFSIKLLHYVIVQTNCIPCRRIINLSTFTSVCRDITDFNTLARQMKRDKIYVVYIDTKGNPVGLIKDDDGDVFMISEYQESIVEFVKMVKNCHTDKLQYSSSETSGLKIASLDEDGDFADSDFEIFRDRTLDMVISKHKPILVNCLQDFQAALGTKSRFHGFGSYNFGIILYGKPGTGKTSIIKAVCNELNRSAYIMNMQQIKTASKFKSLLDNVEDRVLIFEEFDCVEGVISREIQKGNGNDSKQSTHEQELKQLNDRYMKVLEMRTMAPSQAKKSVTRKDEEDDENSDALKDELETIKKSIAELKDKLSLYTFLTVLDGMEEMRGRVMIATTNHIDQIDPALLRPGRFDLKIKLEEFTVDETRELLHKMFKGDKHESDIDEAKFPHMKYTPTEIITMCHVYQTLPNLIRVMCGETPDLVICKDTKNM